MALRTAAIPTTSSIKDYENASSDPHLGWLLAYGFVTIVMVQRQSVTLLKLCCINVSQCAHAAGVITSRIIMMLHSTCHFQVGHWHYIAGMACWLACLSR